MKPIMGNYSECFSDDEWAAFVRQLETAKVVFHELANELGCREIIDNRWPSAGIQNRKCFRQWRMRITLNRDCVFDGEEDYGKTFYVLDFHHCFYIPFFSLYKFQSYAILKKYSVEEIQDKNHIRLEIQQQIELIDKPKAPESN